MSEQGPQHDVDPPVGVLKDETTSLHLSEELHQLPGNAST
jgi:hypothetical protein